MYSLNEDYRRMDYMVSLVQKEIQEEEKAREEAEAKAQRNARRARR